MATQYISKSTTDLTGALTTDNVVVFSEGSQQVTGGMDQSGLANGLAQLLLESRFTGTIGGGAAGPLIVDVDVSPGIVRNNAGGGALYIKPGGGNTLITTLEQVGAGATYVQSGGTVTTAGCARGMLSITTDVICTNLAVIGGTCIQAYKATVNTLLICKGGTLRTGRGITTGHFADKCDVEFSREDTSATLPVATTINLFGGRVKWRGGNITTLNYFGGFLDITEAPADLTITNLNGTSDQLAASGLTMAAGGTITSRTGAVITATNVTRYVGTPNMYFSGGQTFNM